VKSSIFLNSIALLLLVQCGFTEDRKRHEVNSADAQNLRILALIAPASVRADCIYCTDTQANHGSCTCMRNVATGSCS